MATVRVRTTPVNGEIVAVPAETYSTIALLMRGSVAVSARLNLIWYNASHVFISRTAGVDVVLSSTAWTPVTLLAQTSPALTAFVGLEVEYQSVAFDKKVYAKQLVIAQSDDAAFSPGGTVDIRFILERSEDSGVTWLPVYGYSRENPGPSDDPVLTEVLTQDRTSANGRFNVWYQAYAVGVTAQGFVFSNPTVLQDVAPVTAINWWLRDLDRPELDVALRVPSAGRNWAAVLTEWEVQGAEYPDVRFSALPDMKRINFACTILDEVVYAKVETLLHSKRPLVLQSNLGGMKWYAVVVGEVSEEQVSAVAPAGSASLVRHMHQLSCTMRVVGVV